MFGQLSPLQFHCAGCGAAPLTLWSVCGQWPLHTASTKVFPPLSFLFQTFIHTGTNIETQAHIWPCMDGCTWDVKQCCTMMSPLALCETSRALRGISMKHAVLQHLYPSYLVCMLQPQSAFPSHGQSVNPSLWFGLKLLYFHETLYRHTSSKLNPTDFDDRLTLL